MSKHPVPNLTLADTVQSRWAKFRTVWDRCTRCSLHKSRTQVVHARGRLPCSVLFIGEAPGSVEDALGYPFSGPSGKLLAHHIIPDVYALLGRRFTNAAVNVIGCIPKADRHPGTRSSVRPPTLEESMQCRDHLDILIHIAAPRACVLLGKVSAFHIGTHIVGRGLELVPTLPVVHPAYLLRQGGAPTGPDLSMRPAYARAINDIVSYLRARFRMPKHS